MIFHPSGHGRDRDAIGSQVQIAIVTGGQRVLHLAVAPTRKALEPQLAEYVGRHAAEHLYPPDAESVNRLIEQGRPAAAIRHYFDHVGKRWDPEQLSIHAVPLEPEVIGRVCAE